MDITNTTPRRLQVAVELFLEGQSLAYNGVVFWKDNGRALQINSYSDWEPDRTTPVMAQGKIERAKRLLGDLCVKSAEFERIATTLPHEHFFCYDYGMGAFVIAKEVAGVFEWCYGPSKG